MVQLVRLLKTDVTRWMKVALYIQMAECCGKVEQFKCCGQGSWTKRTAW